MYFLVHLRRSLYLWKNFHRETATSTDFCILVETTCTMTEEMLLQCLLLPALGWYMQARKHT